MSDQQESKREERVRESGYTGGGALRSAEPRSWAPFAIAGAVVLIIVLFLFVFGQRRTGLSGAEAAAYASSLPISGIQMSDSSSLSGGKQTYLDGAITNRGGKIVTGITVQVRFKSFSGQPAASDIVPLDLIRSREPYIDTEPVGADPLKPGDSRPFRLIFDSVPQDWDGAYPAVRIVGVETR